MNSPQRFGDPSEVGDSAGVSTGDSEQVSNGAPRKILERHVGEIALFSIIIGMSDVLTTQLAQRFIFLAKRKLVHDCLVVSREFANLQGYVPSLAFTEGAIKGRAVCSDEGFANGVAGDIRSTVPGPLRSLSPLLCDLGERCADRRGGQLTGR